MKLSFRKALLLYTLVPVMAVFLLFAVENILSTKKHEQELIESHMTDLAQSYVNIFNGYLLKVAAQVDIVAGQLSANPELSEQEIYQILEQNVKHSPLVYGMAVAYAPYQFDSERKLFSPYVFRRQDKIKKIDIGLSSYDYTEPKWEWWHKPIATREGVWSEPYFDEGAGNIMMSTYSVPFFKEGEIRGVTTIDIPLHKLNSKMEILGITKYKVFLLSSRGRVLIGSDKNDIGLSITNVIEDKYQSVLKLLGKKSAEVMRKELYILRDDMLSGREGKRVTEMDITGQDIWYFYAPIKSADWSVAIGVNASEAFVRVYNRAWYSIGFFSLLLFLLIAFISLAAGKFSRAFVWIINRCQRIERMNFQPVGKVDTEVKEIRQLSNTLDSMCQALDAHFSAKEDVQIAQSVQEQSQTLAIPEIPGYQIGVWNQITENGYGELYDVIELPQLGRAGFLLLNDADKGIEASVKNAQLRAIYRTAIMQGYRSGEIAAQMNRFSFSDSALNGVVQVWLGVLDIEKGGFISVSLGQNTVSHYSAELNTVRHYPGNSMALSMQKKLPVLTEHVLDILPEDVLVICSEGVAAALNKNRDTFDIAYIDNILQQQCTESAGEILEACKQAFLTFTKEAYVQNECTIFVLKRNTDSKQAKERAQNNFDN